MAAPDCDDVTLGWETIERMKYVRMGDGSFAKRVVTVVGGSELDCDDTEISTSDATMRATEKISATQYADRIVVVT